MRVLLASSEVHPYSKTGGLADMVGALGKALGRKGHRVGLVTPLYTGIRERYALRPQPDLPIDLPLGVRRVSGEIWTHEPSENLTIYFVDQPEFFQRSELYQKDGVDYADNAERFTFLSKTVAHLAAHLNWKPEVLHLHDWQPALAALLLRHQRQLPAWRNLPAAVTTIHNLAYQGVFPPYQFALTNLPWEYLNPSLAEFYGKVNFLKSGIACSDFITTVSPRYAREIMTEEYGCGLDGLLRLRQNAVAGILNGVDYDEWNTSNNGYLKASYTRSDLTGKAAGKGALQAELGLPVKPNAPLFGNIGRMVEQKGVDIMLAALETMLNEDLQVVVLGSGAPAFQTQFLRLASRFPDRLRVKIGYDPGLSHRIEAGCDFFLMPSRFEPCGLNQMYSLRYGTIPVVRRTGGLCDSVIDLQEDAPRANGVKFTEYSSPALTKAVRKAMAIFGDPALLQHYRVNAMSADFSWERTADAYLATYEQAMAAHAAG
jgi:starch synthase